MNVGVLGLGLIGGSLARAYAKAGHRVFAWDRDENIAAFAKLSGVVSDNLTENTISMCDFILLAINTGDAIKWLKNNGKYVCQSALVMDCCGIKKAICDACFPLAQKYGFIFMGGHPMAGSHFSGFKNSRSNLFQGAPMVLVPHVFDDIALLEKAKKLLAPCCFGSFSITTAEKHDEMIAFTSQMPHIVSNAFIKSPAAQSHKGFSAGSYKDLTRVAWLNPVMWAELFLGNRDNVLKELNFYIESLCAYRNAVEENDEDRLIALLEEGRLRKEEVDG